MGVFRLKRSKDAHSPPCAMQEGAAGIRINKYLSEVGHCSRRAADKLFEQGRITINGTVPELGTKVMPGDTVAVDGTVVGQPTAQEDHVYIAYHKPVGIVCTTDRKREKDNIVDAIGHEKRIFLWAVWTSRVRASFS